MVRLRLGLKALGMCALVLGMMAVWAGAAQAEKTGGIWTYLVKGTKTLKTFEGTLAKPAVNGKAVTPIVLHTKVLGGTSLLYECKAFSAAAGSTLLPNGEALGKLIFTECEAFLAGVLSKNCNPPGGTIATNNILVLMLLHELKVSPFTIHKIFIAHPDTGEGSLAIIKSTEACAIGEKVPIGGLIALWDPIDPTTHLVSHKIVEFAPLTHLFVISDTPEHASKILGEAEVFLSGEHTGLEWAALWN